MATARNAIQNDRRMDVAQCIKGKHGRECIAANTDGQFAALVFIV